jgi:hypothetical protein
MPMSGVIRRASRVVGYRKIHPIGNIRIFAVDMYYLYSLWTFELVNVGITNIEDEACTYIQTTGQITFRDTLQNIYEIYNIKEVVVKD